MGMQPEVARFHPSGTDGRLRAGAGGTRASKVLLGMEYVVMAWQTGSLRSVLTTCRDAGPVS